MDCPDGKDSQLHDVPIAYSRSYKHILIHKHKNQSRDNKSLCHNCKRRVYSIQDLPTLVLVNILSRLPIKSIFYSKRVCKEWYKLIKDPLFVNTYLANPSFVSVLFSVGNVLSYLLELKARNDYIPSVYNAKFIRNKLKLPQEPYSELVVIGCCNGLLCLLHGKSYNDDHRLYISNPILGEYVEILQPSAKRVRSFAYGFGCSSATGQFKILRIAKKKYIRQPLKSEAEIYTIGVDHCWRDVGEAPYPSYGKICGVTLNGALHWIADGDHEGDVNLFAFDIKEEKVRKVPSPRGLTGIFFKEVAVLRNCLCIFDNNWSHKIHIWWMKEYGVGESWTRDRIVGNLDSSDLFPITIWRDSEILMGTRSGKLLSCDPEKRKLEKIKVTSMGNVDRCKAIVYVPSFSSLKSIMGDDVQMIKIRSRSYSMCSIPTAADFWFM